MTKRFSHLVWLGAGTASEPTNLLNCAEQITLIEARETACLSLHQQYAQSGINIQQKLLTVDGTPIELIEYNLPEYSATQSVTGLKTLFPGLKEVNSERLNSTRITDFITELALQDQNNLLVADIPDSNLALLMALLQSNLLNLFSEIHLQTGATPLYTGAATATEITIFLEKHGYLLQQTLASDPDLPWLNFSVNPAWQELQQTQQINNTLNEELQQAKQLLVTLQEQLGKKKSESETLHQQLSAAEQSMSDEKAILVKSLSSKEAKLSSLTQHRDQLLLQLSTLQQQNSYFEQLAPELQRMQTEVEKANKNAVARLEKISYLEKVNRTLDETNKQLTKQQKSITQEMTKAEVQINLIKDLLLKQ